MCALATGTTGSGLSLRHPPYSGNGRDRPNYVWNVWLVIPHDVLLHMVSARAHFEHRTTLRISGGGRIPLDHGMSDRFCQQALQYTASIIKPYFGCRVGCCCCGGGCCSCHDRSNHCGCDRFRIHCGRSCSRRVRHHGSILSHCNLLCRRKIRICRRHIFCRGEGNSKSTVSGYSTSTPSPSYPSP